MKKWKKGLTMVMAALMLLGTVPMQSFAALEDTSGNTVVKSSSVPKGKIGKSITIPFKVENDSGSDWEDVSVQIAEGSGFYLGENDLEGGYAFPFEITTTTFKPRYIGKVSAGKSKGASVSAKVRSDLAEGYYAVRIDVIGGDGATYASEFVNIWVSKSTGTEDEEKEAPVTFVMGEGQSTPYGEYPNVLDYSIKLRNSSLTEARDVTVIMGLSKDTAEFPFDINEANYDRTFEKIGAGETVELPYSMAIRSDAYSGYYPLKYTITYRDTADGDLKSEEKEFYVRVKNKEKEDTQGDFNVNDRTRARIVVDSYETIPKDIIAGDPFELVLRMKNASADVPASNIMFSLESEKDKTTESAVFSTESGSSAIVVNSMAPGETTELRVNMLSKAGIEQRSYALTIKEKYDSPEFKNAEESVTIDIPIKQIARLNTGTIEVMPDSITVGSETNVMFPINNTGKVILYNVMVAFESDSIQRTESYVGNIKPGETGNVDVMLSGIAPTADEGKVKIIITYEDENGEVQPEVTKELSLYVTEAMDMDMGDMSAGNMDDMMVPEPSFFQKYKVAIIAAAVVIVAAAAAVFVIRKKKKAAQEEGVDDEIS